MKNKLIFTLAVTCVLIIAIALPPPPVKAAMTSQEVTVISVGIFNDNYYQISFLYEGNTYLKLFSSTKKDWLAIALTAISSSGKAELRFNDEVIYGGRVYSISAK